MSISLPTYFSHNGGKNIVPVWLQTYSAQASPQELDKPFALKPRVAVFNYLMCVACFQQEICPHIGEQQE